MKIKKFLGVIVVFTLGISMLGGCKSGTLFGKEAKEYLSEVDQTAVAVSHDGIVTESIVEKDDESEYPTDELNDFVSDEVKQYNDTNGKDSIKLVSCDVKNGKIKVVLEYNSYKDYAKYHNVKFFYGTIKEAEKAGYAMPEEVVDANNKKTDFASATANETAIQVLVFEEPVIVFVDGEITHTSENAKAETKYKATVNDDAVADGQDTTSAPVYVIMK